MPVTLCCWWARPAAGRTDSPGQPEETPPGADAGGEGLPEGFFDSSSPTPAAIRADVEFLSNDLLEGREPRRACALDHGLLDFQQ